MKRTLTLIKQPSAILTADWHLREDTPICRTDNFEEAMWKKVKTISNLQAAYDCIVLHAGDLFHHWKPSPSLLSKTIERLPAQFYTVYGQHDLPQHNFEMRDRSGIHTLEVAGALTVLQGCHWGQIPKYPSDKYINQSILVWHKMTYGNREPYPGCLDPHANVLLRKYPQFDLIVTGDNHESFIVEYEGRLLVNPGSLTRQTATQIDYKPKVYLWYAKDNTVEPYYLPIDEDVVSREHLDRTEERDERIQAFVDRLDGEWDAGLTFEENLEKAIKANKIPEVVSEIIYKAIE